MIPASNTSGGANNLGLPSNTAPLVNVDGRISTAWWPFFSNLYTRVGGPSSPSITQITNIINNNMAVVPPSEYDNEGSDAIEQLSYASVNYNPVFSTQSMGAGSAATPSLNFSAASTTGIYWANPGIGYSVNGVSIGTMTATGLNGMTIGATTPAAGTFTNATVSGTTTTGSIYSGPGSAGGPCFAFAGTYTTDGIYGASPGVGFSVGGVSVGVATATGLNNMAIGATTRSTGAFTTLSATGVITPSQTNGIVGTTTNNNAIAGSVGEVITSGVVTGVAMALSTVTNITSIVLTAGDWEIYGFGNPTLTAGSLTNVVFGTSSASAALGALGTYWQMFLTTAGTFIIPFPTQRVSIASTTTYYLVGFCTFAGGTCSGSGQISARRMR